MMTSIVKRTLDVGPRLGAAVYRQIRSVFCNHCRAVMAVLVMLLFVAIAAPLTTVQGVVDGNVRDTFAAFGARVAKTIRPGSRKPLSSRAHSFTSAPLLIGAPTNLAVTAASSAGITLSWNAPTGTVHHYEIERSESASEPFVLLANEAGPPF
jgi:hypothetical protein